MNLYLNSPSRKRNQTSHEDKQRISRFKNENPMVKHQEIINNFPELKLKCSTLSDILKESDKILKTDLTNKYRYRNA